MTLVCAALVAFLLVYCLGSEYHGQGVKNTISQARADVSEEASRNPSHRRRWDDHKPPAIPTFPYKISKLAQPSARENIDIAKMRKQNEFAGNNIFPSTPLRAPINAVSQQKQPMDKHKVTVPRIRPRKPSKKPAVPKQRVNIDGSLEEKCPARLPALPEDKPVSSTVADSDYSRIDASLLEIGTTFDSEGSFHQSEAGDITWKDRFGTIRFPLSSGEFIGGAALLEIFRDNMQLCESEYHALTAALHSWEKSAQTLPDIEEPGCGIHGMDNAVRLALQNIRESLGMGLFHRLSDFSDHLDLLLDAVKLLEMADCSETLLDEHRQGILHEISRIAHHIKDELVPLVSEWEFDQANSYDDHLLVFLTPGFHRCHYFVLLDPSMDSVKFKQAMSLE